MAPLSNVRRERFCLALAEGRSLAEAYTLAGYKGHRQNAHRMMTFDDIRERMNELQNQTRQDNTISIQSICDELDAAVAVAKAKGQGSALVSAAQLRARLAGLLVDKQQTQLEVINREQADAETIEQLLAKVTREQSAEAAILLGRAFGLEVRDDGEIYDIDRHKPKRIGNIHDGMQQLTAAPQNQQVIEWRPPKLNGRKREV